MCKFNGKWWYHVLVLCLWTCITFQASKRRDVAIDDLQEVLGSEEQVSLKEQYSMDNTMEDKICDLYDLYVQVLLSTNYSCSLCSE